MVALDALSPIEFTAFNKRLYAVPLVKYFTLKGEVVTAGFGVVHVAPLSIEYL